MCEVDLILTFALKEIRRRGQKELLFHSRWLFAHRYAGLDVQVFLHPFGQPAQIAVAVQGIRTQGSI